MAAAIGVKRPRSMSVDHDIGRAGPQMESRMGARFLLVPWELNIPATACRGTKDTHRGRSASHGHVILSQARTRVVTVAAVSHAGKLTR